MSSPASRIVRAAPHPVPGPGVGNRWIGARLGRAAKRWPNRRVWFRENSHLAGRSICSCAGPALYRPGNGSSPAGRKMVPGNISDTTLRPSVRHRWGTEWSGFEWFYGCERSAVSRWAYCPRGPANDFKRNASAPSRSQRACPMERTRAWHAVALRVWPRSRQAVVFLGTCIQGCPIGQFSGKSRKCRHR